MSSIQAASKLREKYEHFRILVIGRANAGKTTLLKRVCNTDEDPCIYDGRKENLLEPNSGRGIHDINRPFVFRSNPQYIFHDSPGFEAGDESQLKKVQEFIKERAKAKEVYDTNLDYQTNRKNAEMSLEELQAPLFHYKYPPRAGVRLEDMQKDDGDHQKQVKVLIQKTAESLDDFALKMLFVSVQQVNLELCIEYAVK
ncbi:hypothetical protein C0992_005183 [Termitomyces sp. T32_za158]|nr:hypothetical protein C0992_005183 [Termitomyces sp. T32_za158]